MSTRTLSVCQLALFFLGAALAGCGDNQPDDALAGRLGSAEQALTCVNLGAPVTDDAVLAFDPTDATKAVANFGTAPIFNVGTLGTTQRQALLRFDLASIPAGATITSASLQLTNASSIGAGPVNLHRATAPWVETTVSYASYGNAFDATVLASFNPATAGTTITLDVTPQVAAWASLAQPNHGFFIDEPTNGRAGLGSSEASSPATRPALTVCYAPTTCSNGILDGSETGIDCGGNCAPCANPCANVTCTASDACHVAGVCNPSTGICSNPVAPWGTACDDGNACTNGDSCQSGTCVAGAPLSCAPADACHTATCDVALGCVNTAISCDDGVACTIDSCDVAAGCVHDASPCEGLVNGTFDNDLSGWNVFDPNPGYYWGLRSYPDNAVHGGAFSNGITDGGNIWQIAPVDASAHTSIRIRVDVRRMWPEYSGSHTIRILTGTAPNYDQIVIGTHQFQLGGFSEQSALNGVTTTPPGAWYAYTSDDFKPLLPPGTTFIRVELAMPSGAARFDNARFVFDDPSVPQAGGTITPLSGQRPLTPVFAGICTDADGGCASSAWSFGDASTYWYDGLDSSATGDSPAFTWNVQGQYLVSYTVEDSHGAARSTFHTVDVIDAPPQCAASATPSQGAAPLSVQFAANATDDGNLVSYAWSFGDGGTSSSASPSYVYANPGTYQVSLTVTDDAGQSASSSTIVVVTGPNEGIINGTFDTGVAGWVVEDPNPGYYWSYREYPDDAVHGNALSNGITDGGKVWQVAAVDAAAHGSIRIRTDVRRMWPEYGGAHTVHLFTGSAPTYDQVDLGTHQFQLGGFSEQSALSGTTTTPPGGWYAYTSDDIKPLLPPGTTFIRVELAMEGAARFDNVRFVFDDATLPQAGGTITPLSGARPLTPTFGGTCSDADGGCSASWWNFGTASTYWYDGLDDSATGDSPSYTWTVQGQYLVSFTVEDAHGAARSTFHTVDVIDGPPTCAADASPPVGPAPLSVQFSSNASDDGTIAAYAWSFGDGGTSTSPDPTYVYANPGTYTVNLTVTDDAGQSASSSTVVVVTGAAEGIVNGTFDVDLGGWVVEDPNPGYYWGLRAYPDDAVHGNVYSNGITSGGRIWQVAQLDVAAHSSVRIRADVRRMWPEYSSAHTIRLTTGTAPSYDQIQIGAHQFQLGNLSEQSALSGVTVTPATTWVSFTSDDFKALIPAGTTLIRVELDSPDGAVRMDNVRFVLDDTSVPSASASASFAGALATLSGTCTDADGDCAASFWNFGDSDFYWYADGGSAASGDPAFFQWASSGTYLVSYTVEDLHGAARSFLFPVNAP